jgi:ABC-2 type transport system permease protein
VNSSLNNYQWLVRRELWEHRAIWMVPSVISAILILLSLFGQVHVFVFDAPLELRQQGAAMLAAIGVMYLVVLSVTVTLYYLDCLYDDRRDRSVLFWKSLPISDTETVLSKLIVGALVMPLVYYVISQVTALVVACILSVRYPDMRHIVWQGDVWLQIQVFLLYLSGLFTLWYLPLIGWSLLVSTTVKRAPLLWSVLPILVVFLIEKFFLGHLYLSRLIGDRFVGVAAIAFNKNFRASSSQSVWDMLNFKAVVTSTEVWLGLAVGVAFIVATIQLRKRRTEV